MGDVIEGTPFWSPAWRNRYQSEKASRPSIHEVFKEVVRFMDAVDVPTSHAQQFVYEVITSLIRAEVLPASMPRPPKPKKRKKRKHKHG